MEDKLRAYMDHLFRDVKPTRKSVELKEEILQNLVDKYQDLLEKENHRKPPTILLLQVLVTWRTCWQG